MTGGSGNSKLLNHLLSKSPTQKTSGTASNPYWPKTNEKLEKLNKPNKHGFQPHYPNRASPFDLLVWLVKINSVLLMNNMISVVSLDFLPGVSHVGSGGLAYPLSILMSHIIRPDQTRPKKNQWIEFRISNTKYETMRINPIIHLQFQSA